MTPAWVMTACHLSISSPTNFRYVGRSMSPGSEPVERMYSCVACCITDLRISLFSVWMMSTGVPAGA
ncbi:hypothetical protein D3C87_1237760 [compost metagenome]